jgi:8-oxo-dGTP pyrophosphatase MutT (NUDIX family)
MQDLTEAIISHQLAEAYKNIPEESPISAFLSDAPRPAAVLIPLFCASLPGDDQDSWQVLLTRRTESVAEHRGQVAFPGGRADPTDTSPEMTALREAREEVGLDPLQVRLLGRMNSMWTISNYLVTPVVGVIPWPFPIQPEETEVSRVFSIPLDWLADPTHHEIRLREIPHPYSQLLQRESHPVIYFLPYNGEVLWGVSAEITLNLIKILYPSPK